jgi:hypothetical protein
LARHVVVGDRWAGGPCADAAWVAAASQDNPSRFTNPLQFEIQYECLTSLQEGTRAWRRRHDPTRRLHHPRTSPALAVAANKKYERPGPALQLITAVPGHGRSSYAARMPELCRGG